MLGNPAPPGVMLAKTLAAVPVDPTGYWMSEKIDGVRAYWDGTHLISRQGNVFAAPDWFTDCLPDEALDGELWMGRGTFNQTSGAVRRARPHDGWRYIVYFVFDAPAHSGPYEERQEHLEQLVGRLDCQYMRKVPSVQLQSKKHLDTALAAVIKLGGEGLMIVRPGSYYTPRRTDSILKVKKFEDAEAVVFKHEPGKGKHKGRMGALWVREKDGIEFKVGTGFSDRERDKAMELYPPGTVITFRFFERTPKGKPREPRFERVRAEEPEARRQRRANLPAPARASNVLQLRRRLSR